MDNIEPVSDLLHPAGSHQDLVFEEETDLLTLGIGVSTS